MYKLFYFILIIQVLFTVSCDTTESDKNGTIFTELADASCTECWINVETTGISLAEDLTLYRDNEIVQTATLTESNTVLYDSLLSPSQTYEYKVKIAGTTSKEYFVTTMDTTSHDFSWETFTFGEHSSSVLNDVAIIDENNIWAVGEIYINDSTGSVDPSKYNLAIWDGTRWNIRRVYFTNSHGQSFLAAINSINGFSNTNILLGMDQIILWHENDFMEIELSTSVFNSWINSIWGKNTNDFYIAGNNGNLAHYNGTTWTKIDGGTENNIVSVWGVENQFTGNEEIYYTVPEEEALYRMVNGQYTNNTGWDENRIIRQVWSDKGYSFYAASVGVYTNNLNKGWTRIEAVDEGLFMEIEGNANNDVFIAGLGGRVIHFNGSTWYEYDKFRNSSLFLLSLDYKDNLIVMTGTINGNAVIIKGVRQ